MDHDVSSAVREAALAFGPFHYRPATRTLETEDRQEVLPPRVGSALEAFLARPGQTLSKEELVEEIWSGAWVSDTALTEAISLLRQALGDDSRNPSFIQTVRARGYRFLAPVETVEELGPAPDPNPVQKRRRFLGLAPVAATLLAAVAIVGVHSLRRPRPTPPAPTVRFSVPLPSLESVPLLLPLMAVSPDGRRIVVAGKGPDGHGRLWSREIDRLELTPIDGTEGGLGAFFSPDGRSIAFFRGSSLLRVPLAGGAPRTVAEGGLWKGGTWLEDGTIVVGGTGLGGLGTVSADSGAIEPLTTIDADRGELGHWWPVALPETRKVLFTIVGSLRTDSQIAVLDLATRRWHTVVDDGWSPRFLPPDRLLFARGNRVMEVPFDIRAGEVVGPPRPALDGVASLPGTSSQFDVSPTGTLAYLEGPPTDSDAELVRVENGRVGGRVVPEARSFESVAVDAVTGRIAVSITGEESSDLWIVENGGLRRLTFAGKNFLPVWAPGGEELYFASDRDGSLDIYRKSADGASPAVRVLSTPGHVYPQTASPDGRWLVYALTDAETGWDLWRLDLVHPHETPAPLVVGPADQLQASISSDGRWLAYSSNETGRWEVFVEPTDRSGSRWQVTTGGGALPFWSPTGETLFCMTPGRVVARTVLGVGGRAFRTGPSRVVFDQKDDLHRGLGLLRATAQPGELVGIRNLEPTLQMDPLTDLQVVVRWQGGEETLHEETPQSAPP